MVSYSDLTDKAAVSWAICEFDRLGRKAVLNRYGYGEALRYFVVVNGSLYDSKAIFGAAYERQHGVAISHKEITGGKDKVAKRLVELGFEVQGDAVQPARHAAPSTVICQEHCVEVPVARSCPYC